MANEAVNKEAKGSQEVASLISQISDGIKGGIEKAQELAVETEKHKQIKALHNSKYHTNKFRGLDVHITNELLQEYAQKNDFIYLVKVNEGSPEYEAHGSYINGALIFETTEFLKELLNEGKATEVSLCDVLVIGYLKEQPNQFKKNIDGILIDKKGQPAFTNTNALGEQNQPEFERKSNVDDACQFFVKIGYNFNLFQKVNKDLIDKYTKK